MSETIFFGKWIAQRRKTLDMTQRELAAQTNCTLATIKKIEQDERRPSRELAEGMASALRIPADKIAMFVECARGLRSVDVLISIGGGGGAEKNEARTAMIPVVILPSQSTPFIGRETELSQIAAYLDDATCRLLTLVGPGGIGKTRLAYQVAASTNGFRSGVYAVPLAGVSTADALLPAIAERLKFTFQSGDPKAQLLHFLHQKRLLLILDNLEHLLDGVGLLSEILQVAPGVKILATSRERLNLSAEWLFPVDGLLFPTDADQKDQAGFSAVQLFEGCARRALPVFHLADQLSATIHICQLLEGMPLAIELAASWVRQMSCKQISEQIQRDLNFLSVGRRDVPERHRSIRALFEHSWQLLSKEEQDVMMKLSVFRGGFEPEVAQQIAGASLYTLSALEDKSLVQGSPSGRYNLHELIRQYAESHLNDAEKSAEIQNHHLDYYMAWAETAEKQLHTGEQINAARRIKSEYNNLRAALTWAFDGGDPEKGLRVTNALWFYWFRWSGNRVEGFKWTERGLNQTEGITPARADAYGHAGTLAAQMTDMRTAIDYMQRSFEFSQALGLSYGIARYVMGMSYTLQDYALVAAKFEEAIALLRETGPRFMLATALFLYGDRARVQGDLDRAQSLYDESLMIARAEHDFQMMTAPLAKLGRLATLKGDYQQAHHFYDEGMELARQVDVTIVIAEYSLFLGAMAVYQGDYESAKHHLNEALAVWEELADSGGIIQVTYFLAELALHRLEFVEAARLLVESIRMTLADSLWQNNFSNHEFNTERLIIAGKLACALGDYAQAGWLLSVGEVIRAQSSYLFDALARAEYENAAHEVRTALGNEAFDRIWQEGQSLTQEAALGRTLEYLQAVLVKGNT